VTTESLKKLISYTAALQDLSEFLYRRPYDLQDRLKYYAGDFLTPDSGFLLSYSGSQIIQLVIRQSIQMTLRQAAQGGLQQAFQQMIRQTNWKNCFEYTIL